MVLLFRSLGPFTARVRRRGAVVNVILPQYNRLARRDYHVRTLGDIVFRYIAMYDMDSLTGAGSCTPELLSQRIPSYGR